MRDLSHIDAAVLMIAEERRGKRKPIPVECSECLSSCHPDDSKENFFQWQQNQMCRQCNDNEFQLEQNEFRSMPR